MTQDFSGAALFASLRRHLSAARLGESTGVSAETISALFDRIEWLLKHEGDTSTEDLIIYTDGAARGNPGPAGIGVILEQNDGSPVAEISDFFGITTNNHAEYLALLAGLKKAVELGAKTVMVKSDSELLVRQLQGIYRVRNERLRRLFDSCRSYIEKFSRFEIIHIPRSENKRADALANRAINAARTGKKTKL